MAAVPPAPARTSPQAVTRLTKCGETIPRKAAPATTRSGRAALNRSHRVYAPLALWARPLPHEQLLAAFRPLLESHLKRGLCMNTLAYALVLVLALHQDIGDVTSSFDKKADFGTFRTYAWGKGHEAFDPAAHKI